MDSGVTREMLNQFCDGCMNFLSVVDLIYTVWDDIVYHGSIFNGLLTIVNNFGSPYNPLTSKKSVIERLNIFSSAFENRQM